MTDTASDISIPKPDAFDLSEFMSNADTSGVGAVLRPLPHHNLAGANDFVRLHPDEASYWSPELCFVNVPIVGQRKDQLHLIKKEIAERNQVPESRLKFHRLALASKPHDQLFLCHVPSRNLDNVYNSDAIHGCQRARAEWVYAASKQKEGGEGYHIIPARDKDAFLPPKWPAASLLELIELTFDANRRIAEDDHAALGRILGRRPDLG